VSFTNHGHQLLIHCLKRRLSILRLSRNVRLRVTSGGELVFQGWIEDWDFDYSPSGDSVATAKAIDALTVIANQTLDGFTPSVEKAGARIAAVLDRPEIGWPSTLRDLDEGAVDMAANPVDTGHQRFDSICRTLPVLILGMCL
jgi:hypothetical protein